MVTILAACVLIALGFGIGAAYRRGIAPIVAVVAWLAYPPYEFWVQKTCTGECNIRVDLVLIAPILLILSIVAVVSLVRGGRRRQRRPRA